MVKGTTGQFATIVFELVVATAARDDRYESDTRWRRFDDNVAGWRYGSSSACRRNAFNAVVALLVCRGRNDGSMRIHRSSYEMVPAQASKCDFESTDEFESPASSCSRSEGQSVWSPMIGERSRYWCPSKKDSKNLSGIDSPIDPWMSSSSSNSSESCWLPATDNKV